MRLPEAYRSLPRPSSPTAAKASATRPYSLDALIQRRTDCASRCLPHREGGVNTTHAKSCAYGFRSLDDQINDRFNQLIYKLLLSLLA